jgi:hypothetical protein
MEVVCPTCNTKHAIVERKLPKRKAVGVCKQCGGRIILEPNSSSYSHTTVGPSPSPGHYAEPLSSSGNRQAEVLTLFADYPDLQGLDPERFDLEAIFGPNRSGGYRNRKNNLKVKILTAIQDPLNKILKNDERVMRIARGVAYYPAEIFFGNGFFTMIYNHYAILCTDRRLIFVNANSKMNRPTHYFFQLAYQDIKKVGRGLMGGGLTVHQTRGKRRTFLYVKGHSSKDLKNFIMGQKKTTQAVEPLEESLENLCPSCFTALEEGLVRCPHCRADFKVPRKAFLRSLVLPGLGDIYLGHKGLGILELIGSVIVWGVVISSVLEMGHAGLIVALFLLPFYNGVDGLLTRHMARKGYMLAEN